MALRRPRLIGITSPAACPTSMATAESTSNQQAASPGEPSGFGFEVTFRLKRDARDSSPPTWPVDLMQALARYVVHSRNLLCAGDHVSWQWPLGPEESRLQHLLLVEDPQLKPLDTGLGTVRFVQITAVSTEELQAAQRWTGTGVAALLREHRITGGQWLVTDMRRGECLFDVNNEAEAMVEEGWQREGSTLSGVSVQGDWEDVTGKEKGISGQCGEAELQAVEVIDHLRLHLTIEAVRLLPLALRGRIGHHRHFTFKYLMGEKAVTLVGSGVEGCFADKHTPFVCRGPWLQVFVGRQFSADLLETLEPLLHQAESLPPEVNLSQHKLSINILHQSEAASV